MPEFAQLQANYDKLWRTMAVRPERAAVVEHIARKLIAHKARYQAVEARTAVPWFVIAALHNRESDADFATYLGNGEPLDRVTRLVPKGRGPFASWEAGAIDALRLDGLNRVEDWWTPAAPPSASEGPARQLNAARACFEIEKFNGFGYWRRGLPSPYLWSFSNHYARGKYVADGQFDVNAIDRQCGAIPILKRIMELDETARFAAGRPTPPSAPAALPNWLQQLVDAIRRIIRR